MTSGGVYLNADVTMRAHITATATACFAALWQIRSVVFTDARCLADADVRYIHHKARLLLFGIGWCIWIADATATVHVERCRSTSPLNEEIGAHNSMKVLDREFSLGCVFWHIIVFMARRHRT